jgi:membrane associated rhomboid family serine protease
MRAGEARTISMIASVTALAYLVASLGGWNDVLSYAAGFIPARVTQPDLLDHAGLGIPVVPLFLTPLTSTLLHGGWLHLGFNLLIFLYCGRQVEMVLGGRLLFLLYGLGAYTAAAGQWLLGPDLAIPMIGASGAISAIIGAYALMFGNRRVRAFGPIPASVVRMLWLGAGWIFIQFLIGVATASGGIGLGGGGGEIAIGAHIGGFVGGMIVTRPLLLMRFRGANGVGAN